MILEFKKDKHGTLNLRFPVEGYKNIVGFFCQLVGMFFFGTAMFQKISMDFNIHFFVMVGLGSIICFEWSFLAFLAEMLAESLTETHESGKQGFMSSISLKIYKPLLK